MRAPPDADSISNTNRRRKRSPEFRGLFLAARNQADAAGARDGSLGQGVGDDLGLLLLVALARAGGGAGAIGAAHIAQLAAAGIEQRLDLLAHETPGPHVAGFFLHPGDL